MIPPTVSKRHRAMSAVSISAVDCWKKNNTGAKGGARVVFAIDDEQWREGDPLVDQNLELRSMTLISAVPTRISPEVVVA